MPKLSEPSLKARKYVKNKVNGMSNYKAAVTAGYAPATAKNAAQNVEKQELVAQNLLEGLKKNGLTWDNIALKFREGVDATRPVVFKGELIEWPDTAVRFRYLALLTVLMGGKDSIAKEPPIPLMAYVKEYWENSGSDSVV